MGVGRKHGKLFLDFTWRGVRCKEYVGFRDTPENRKELGRRLRLIRAQIENGTFDYRDWFPEGRRLGEFYPDEAPKKTLGEYLEVWIQRRSPFRRDGSLIDGHDLHPTTWYRYNSAIRSRLVPALGHHRLTDLSREHIRQYRRDLEQDGLSGSFITSLLSILNGALAYAAEEDLIASNPMPTFARRLSQKRLTNARPLSAGQVKRFLEALPEHVVIDRGKASFDGEMLRDLYTAWFRTGWRPNEIVALRFDCLDFATEKVEIRAGRYRHFGGGEALPKTGERLVECGYDPEIFACFRRRRDAGLSEYVFTDSLGHPLRQQQLAERVWLPTLQRAGLERRGQYNVKHTFVTLALSSGEDPGWVARVCGTSERMIWRHYRRWFSAIGSGHGGQIAARLRKAVPKRGPERVGVEENATAGGERGHGSNQGQVFGPAQPGAKRQ